MTASHRLATKLHFKLLKSLNNKWCKQFGSIKIGGLPPIQFVPESDLEQNQQMLDWKRNTVKIKINAHVMNPFEFFVIGGPETTIMLIQNSWVNYEQHKGLWFVCSCISNDQPGTRKNTTNMRLNLSTLETFGIGTVIIARSTIYPLPNICIYTILILGEDDRDFTAFRLSLLAMLTDLAARGLN